MSHTAVGDNASLTGTRFAEILSELACDDSIAPEVLERGIHRFPAYSEVPSESLIEAVERNRALAIQALRSGVIPPPEQIWEAALSTHERLAQGVPIADIMGGFRESLKVIQSRVIAATASRGFPPEAALRASTLLWDLGDTFSARISLAYREIQIADAIARKHDQERCVHRLLEGNLTDLEMQTARASMHGIGLVKAIATSPISTHSRATLPATLVITADRAIGYIKATETLPRGIDYSEGPTVEWSDLPRSFRTAQQLRAAAEYVGVSGRTDLARMSWRIGVPASQALNEFLQRTYIDPVVAHGEFGAMILNSVRCYLEFDLKINPAAASIPVHPNTLRYRIQKFEDFTGKPLTRFDTQVEVAWVLAAHHSLRTSPSEPNG